MKRSPFQAFREACKLLHDPIVYAAKERHALAPPKCLFYAVLKAYRHLSRK